ncbi:hypothetical protein EOJ36_08645 [Sandaracinomonas limnophila]|uniref:Uncharacterized protein n=1 Tax=Sandaracinomonas limnophila TaxID=1862386 RepID=A0A437PS27_9BACT|nr:hypothetical protein [Sandaracinomonas limnophila]RVU25063.1 hypothetical protein EOJ36_08645 [Sandaracinomonas limnophila]
MKDEIIEFCKLNNWLTWEEVACAIFYLNRTDKIDEINPYFEGGDNLPKIVQEQLKKTNGFFMFDEQLQEVYRGLISKDWNEFSEWLARLNTGDQSVIDDFKYFELTSFLLLGSDNKYSIPYPQNLIYEVLQEINLDYSEKRRIEGKAILKFYGNIMTDEVNDSTSLLTKELNCFLIQDNSEKMRIAFQFDVPDLELYEYWEYGVNFKYSNTEKIEALGCDNYMINKHQFLLKLDPFIENKLMEGFDHFGMACLFEGDFEIDKSRQRNFVF